MFFLSGFPFAGCYKTVMETDGEMLRCYVVAGSEEAFEQLVRRHLNLVYSAALRQVNGDAHLAQDVVQTVFADLARKAKSLSRHPALRGWLYTSTHFAAAKAVRKEQRRHTHEQEAQAMQKALQAAAPDLDWTRLRPVLDSAMHELKAAEREAILSRYFENRSLAEVGRQFQVSEDAARKRVDRALEKLRLTLNRRGLAAGAALASLISANAIQVAPAGLAGTIATSTAGAAAGIGTTLTFLKLMAMNKIASGLAGAIVLAGVATPLVMLHRSQVNLRNEDRALRRQVDQVSALIAENQRLSNLVAHAGSQNDLLNDQITNMRGEIASLRTQTNQLGKMQQAHARLEVPPSAPAQANSSSDVDKQAQWQKLSIAKMNDAKQLVLALFLYLRNHRGHFPTDFAKVGKYLPKTGPPLTLTNKFDVVYDGPWSRISNQASAIVLRESQPWPTDDGKWARTYGFADGHCEVHVQADPNFAVWEKKHTVVLSQPASHQNP